MKKYFKLIIALLFLMCFIILGSLILNNNILIIDKVIYNFVSNFITNFNTNLMKLFAFLGSSVFVISVAIFSLLKNKKYGLLLSIDLIVITLFQKILKLIFRRTRPIGINIISEKGFSFPSGHSLTAVAFYGLMIYFIYNSDLNKKSKIIFIALFCLLIFNIGLSRIYLGVHYFSDVIGGYLFSLFYLIIFTHFVEKIK